MTKYNLFMSARDDRYQPKTSQIFSRDKGEKTKIKKKKIEEVKKKKFVMRSTSLDSFTR